ncbi:hypothetical protein [Paenibacillus sp. N3.4]|uniref:hypothetical protein n=1 Tax=Paenibacillus sp. N3.4 TaxID=2603222 RepID=UPI0011CC569F|nr:hypothetical protein [Paenibacillus sp. N3.4]TXK81450.1 hypothetical protein FU659_16250 [Paenibacillus sp. N3.4]
MRNITALLTALALASAIPAGAAAAAQPIEFTSTIQSSLDKTMAGAGQSQANKINSQYNEFRMLQSQEQDWDVKINALHDRNEEALNTLNLQLKQVDSAKLDKLEADIAQTRERYKPLLSQYTALNKQIEAAKLLKSKDFSGLLRLQAAAMKIPVQLARLDIRTKEKALQTAKGTTTKTTKKTSHFSSGHPHG